MVSRGTPVALQNIQNSAQSNYDCMHNNWVRHFSPE